MLKYALLGFLNYSPQSGYDLKQLMDISTTNFWHAKQSQIYTTLKKLEESTLAVSHVEPQQNHPDRRVYTITQAGKDELRSWLLQPLTTIEPNKRTLLLKLFFSAQIDFETILAGLHLQRNLHQAALEKHQSTSKAVIQQFRASEDMQKDALLWEATRRFGELYEEMFVRWIDETIQNLEGK